MLEQLNKLLMHYGYSTGVGLKMQLFLELFTLEMEGSSQPLQEAYIGGELIKPEINKKCRSFFLNGSI